MGILNILVLILAITFIQGSQSTTLTITNHCPFTIWPAILTGSGPAASSTGFELASQASTDVTAQPQWSGRVWARTQCSNSGGSFSCLTGDCGSNQIPCNGKGGAPPATLIEYTLAGGGNNDFFDVSLVDGFNLPVNVVPSGSGCKSTGCPVDINAACPNELAIMNGGAKIGCKSACLAFGKPEFCCSGSFATPDVCKPSNYSQIFKNSCPQAYSYAYDDKTSTFTCPNGGNYQITFCP
ncbi:thaumatin-like protein 1 [Impatiens glandulifera]|uniref:thaumatin-like protein 1 n=1 Tax=Impatiens glandulifera TaxID=253017 RepID=UPI001FB09283|nr:thaumatin-like protein 1 [Impatiens glandulifera]